MKRMRRRKKWALFTLLAERFYRFFYVNRCRIR
jgi:hypothetical protein